MKTWCRLCLEMVESNSDGYCPTCGEEAAIVSLRGDDVPESDRMETMLREFGFGVEDTAL